MPNYTHTTRAQFKSSLLARLGDPLGVHWIDDELNFYVAEALRMWAQLTGFWRGRATFNTSTATPFYDLNALPQLAGLTDYTVSCADVIYLVEYMLIEPKSASGVGMSDQFNFADIVAAVQRARNQFLDDTFITLSQLSITVDPSSNLLGRVDLPDTVTSIRRAIWRAASGTCYNVHWSDENEATLYNSLFSLMPGIPDTYSILASPPLQMELIPAPVDIGTLELIVSTTGADLDPTATPPTLLGIPDDTTWAVRELALADLLGRDGPAHDPIRSTHAQSRYQLAVQIANQSAQLIYAEIDGVPVIPSGLAEIDYAYSSPHWQGVGLNAPTDIGVIGGNLAGLRPLPDGPHPISLDVVRKAPQPTSDASFIQLGREDMDALLDCAQSLAMFKLGGADVGDAERLFSSVVDAATRYNAKLSVLGYGESMQRISRTDEGSRPERGTGRGVGTASVAAAQAASQSSASQKGS